MVIAVWTETNMACPFCKKSLRRGRRRFGPGRVICSACQGEITTGLIDPYSVSKARRVFLLALEWFFPAYFRGMDQPAKMLVMFYHLALVGFSPLLIVLFAGMALAGGRHASDALAGLPFGLLGLLHFMWLRNMLKEARAYHDDGTVPVWKAPFIAR
jgi:hypothetical protein